MNTIKKMPWADEQYLQAIALHARALGATVVIELTGQHLPMVNPLRRSCKHKSSHVLVKIGSVVEVPERLAQVLIAKNVAKAVNAVEPQNTEV